MQANLTLVIDLPVNVDELMADLKKMTDNLVEPRVWQASYQEAGGQRDPHPAQVSLTIGGQVDIRP